MKRFIIFPLLILGTAAVVNAEVYTWTDEQGVVTFTDDPDKIPARISGSQKSGDVVSIQTPKAQQGLRTRGTKLSAAIPRNRIKSTPARVHKKQVPLVMQSEVKGHLGGDQTDPAPPSMKQPKPIPTGDQPKTVAPGMKQPKPADIGEQPKETPAGMKQPQAESVGAQPPPVSSGMEQPDSKQ